MRSQEKPAGSTSSTWTRREEELRVLARRAGHEAWKAYNKLFLELVLRQKPLPPSKDGRHVPLRIHHDRPLVDSRRGHPYISNSIRTSRYTVYDFFPKQLIFQLSRLANFYFLCVGIPQVLGWGTTGQFTSILPLMFFVLLTIAKEGYDDYRRHRLDKVENANVATVLGRIGDTDKSWLGLERWRTRSDVGQAVDDEEHEGARWVKRRWRDIRVGDVLRLDRDEAVPADVALLYTDGEDGLAYIETMALDGETNLKRKEVSPLLHGCDTIAGIAACNALFVAEDPNPDLYRFDGRITLDEKTRPLTLSQVIYRGSVIRNTSRVIGIVLNTGEESKMRKNANQHPSAKRPNLESMVNRVVITLAVYVVTLSVGCTAGYLAFQQEGERKAWYLSGAKVPMHHIVFGFIIQFNNVIPLALYVSLEIVKVGQLLMLNSDVEMYHAETDTPARCNTNTILENLGQVGFVFSDKTGTLTDNVMKFRKLSVAGTSWLHDVDLDGDESEESLPRMSTGATSLAAEEPHLKRSPSRRSSQWQSTGRPDHAPPEATTADLIDFLRLRPHAAFSLKAKEYILALALCHTCLPEVVGDKIQFQASSPDELALVRAAQELGYLVIQRSSQSITLRIRNGDNEEKMTFEILDIIEFSSKRKRMSVILRWPDGRVGVICKGADSVVFPRLRMAVLAMEKADEVRRSVEAEHLLLRKSEQQEVRNSFGGRPSLTVRRVSGHGKAAFNVRAPPDRRKSFEVSKLRRSGEILRPSLANRGSSFDLLSPRSAHAVKTLNVPERLAFLDDPALLDESTIFSRCFRHLDEFATEGLRTLVFAQKFVTEQEYRSWKEKYDAATTSLVDRQERIEEAGDVIEQAFELVGASAIEDKLQQGVPETIDKLRRANIKIWMLTGDKRETAINIAHSARICRPSSDLFVLDVAKGDLGAQLQDMRDDLSDGVVHSVIVIDGHTLGAVQDSAELSALFFGAVPIVDSVICCRASPAQKALLVKTVRAGLQRTTSTNSRGLTLAIGDGANDLAMIEASHVGVGLSGKEGLQAARVADYSVAQFRYLQRLLLVHGRWNYVRTARFILCTFWKEMFFYLPTAIYQQFNGYSGTSLYQEASLTVFNTLFTSLCVICMGIWEQDLRAETLLAVPELYVYGQRNGALNWRVYFLWMVNAAVEGVLAWWLFWGIYGFLGTGEVRDQGLYALGHGAFTVGVLWINFKLMILETHYKSQIVIWSFFITTVGWFAWTAFLDGVYARSPSPYALRDTFTEIFGRDVVWWGSVLGVLAVLGLGEVAIKAAMRNFVVWRVWEGGKRRGWWEWLRVWERRRGLGAGAGDERDGQVESWGLGVWQEIERGEGVRERFRRMLREEGTNGEENGEGEGEERDGKVERDEMVGKNGGRKDGLVESRV